MTETQIWGFKNPETPEDEIIYHDDISGALSDLEDLGFSVNVVDSYGNIVLVVQRRRAVPEIVRR